MVFGEEVEGNRGDKGVRVRKGEEGEYVYWDCPFVEL